MAGLLQTFLNKLSLVTALCFGWEAGLVFKIQGKPIANHRFLGSARFETTSNSPVDLGGVHYWTECPIKSDKLIDPGSTLRLLGSEGNLPRTTPLFMSAGLKGDGFGRTPAARFWPKVSCASLKDRGASFL